MSRSARFSWSEGSWLEALVERMEICKWMSFMHERWISWHTSSLSLRETVSFRSSVFRLSRAKFIENGHRLLSLRMMF